jgi:parvulin-like peptidyl-prolyl isomerase
VQSGYGQHLVRVEAFEPGSLPPLDAVRDRVELDWRAQRASDMRAARFEKLRAQYDIALPAIEDIVKP